MIGVWYTTSTAIELWTLYTKELRELWGLCSYSFSVSPQDWAPVTLCGSWLDNLTFTGWLLFLLFFPTLPLALSFIFQINLLHLNLCLKVGSCGEQLRHISHLEYSFCLYLVPSLFSQKTSNRLLYEAFSESFHHTIMQLNWFFVCVLCSALYIFTIYPTHLLVFCPHVPLPQD